MTKTLIVCGYGPGISTAVADKFGAEGFAIALVARNADKLQNGVKALEAKGIKAAAITADLTNPTDARAVVAKARDALGPITVLHWNAYAAAAGNLLEADAGDVRAVLDVAVTSLLAVVREALPDLRKEQDAAVLVTNGGLALLDAKIDAMAVQYNAMGLALANAAKHKLVRLLAQKLKPDNVYVGEVMVQGTIKGSAADQGNANLEGAKVADKFWEIYRARREPSVSVS
ncbi:MAG TPA: SDR family NAD(P)-dependent oxidoreductase [Vicinamibacterales bacterium]|jgi:short-subunit dehydrogenase|nr:SDR family NAD(P)-dependent oxidoreductase [Vicinamibacterales bacterium]